MTVELGVMIEAQEGLTWERWRRVVSDTERCGFAALRTSDHCMSLTGEARPTLQSWVALALAAEWSSRLQLGPMVSPLTFYRPAVLARMAKAVDQLSGGRLILGVGAGWNAAEHEAFGIPFPSWRERFDNLEHGLELMPRALAGHPIPLLIGGGGDRTLGIAARWAAEWNHHNVDAGTFGARSAALDERCRRAGRDPGSIRRSLMMGYLIGRGPADLASRLLRLADLLPALRGLSPEGAPAELRRRGWLVGTPGEIVAQVRPYAEAGATLVLLQHYLLDDADALELLATEVAPPLRQ